jgi:hypothetical protein
VYFEGDLKKKLVITLCWPRSSKERAHATTYIHPVAAQTGTSYSPTNFCFFSWDSVYPRHVRPKIVSTIATKNSASGWVKMMDNQNNSKET